MECMGFWFASQADCGRTANLLRSGEMANDNVRICGNRVRIVVYFVEYFISFSFFVSWPMRKVPPSGNFYRGVWGWQPIEPPQLNIPPMEVATNDERRTRCFVWMETSTNRYRRPRDSDWSTSSWYLPTSPIWFQWRINSSVVDHVDCPSLRCGISYVTCSNPDQDNEINPSRGIYGVHSSLTHGMWLHFWTTVVMCRGWAGATCDVSNGRIWSNLGNHARARDTTKIGCTILVATVVNGGIGAKLSNVL